MFSDAGLTTVRFIKSLAAGRGDRQQASAFARSRIDWTGFQRDQIVAHLKADVPATDSGDISNTSGVQSDFLAMVRPLSIFGQLHDRMHRVKARTPMLTQVAGGKAYWVGSGAARKLCVGSYARDEGLRLKSISAITAVTNEALADPSLGGDLSLKRDLAAACTEAIDRAFVDPANDGTSGAPASITNGITPIVHSGGSVADLDDDLREAMAALAAASNLRDAVWIMPSALAACLSLARAADGSLAYPKLSALGGELCGLPVIASGAAEEAPNTDDLDTIILVDAAQIAFDEAPPELRVSEDAMLEMSNTPTGDATTPTAASVKLMGLWQIEASAIKATLHATWKRRRDTAVQLISSVPRELSAT